MGKIPKEFDLTTSARPELVKSLFPRVFDTGIRHGTVTVVLDRMRYEITTFRSEKGYSDGRRPDSVEFSTSLEEDLKRRDFTMNAICLNILSGEWIDLHQGREDIERKVIRTIGNPVERFSEDGLRPIRAIRFACTLDFDLDPDTEKAFLQTRSVTARVSVERFQVELNKILKSPHPQKGIELLKKYDYFSLFISTPLLDVPRYEYLSSIEKLRERDFLERESIPWFAFSLIWLDSRLFNRNKNPLRELKLSNEIEKDVFFLLETWRAFEKIIANSAVADEMYIYTKILSPIREYATRSGWKEGKLYSLFLECLAPNLPVLQLTYKIRKILDSNPPLVVKDLAIDGNKLKQVVPDAKGEKVGILLKKVLEAVWKREISNEEDTILRYLKDMEPQEMKQNHSF